MRAPYPEVAESVPRIQSIVREEEERFLNTLEDGIKFLDATFKKTRAAGSDTISGADAFRLHATYGFPVEITESLAAEQNLRVDMNAFQAEQNKHSDISRGTSE